MTAALADLGLALADWIVWMTVWTGVLFLAARAIDAAVARRVTPGWRAVLYATLLVRVLLPARWASPMGWSTHVVLGETGAPPLSAVLVPSAAVPGPGAALPWPAIVLFGYVAVAVALLLIWQRSRAQVAATLVEPIVPGAEPPVLASDGYGPAVVGLLRPSIAVPRRLLASLPPESLDWIVRHERAHVRRGDHLVLAGIQFTAVVLWPLFPVWLAAARVRALIELACDRTTLEGCVAAERRSYQETLLMLASENARRVRPRMAPAFSGGSLVERVRAARSDRALPTSIQAIAVVVCAALLTACAGLAAEEEASFRVDDDDVVLLSLRSQGLEELAEGEADGEPRQVLVEAQVFSTSEQTATWLVPAAAEDGGEAVLQLIQEDSRVRILTCPSVVTQEGEEATIFIGRSKRVLDPESDDPRVRPVEVELVGAHPEFEIERGIELRLVVHEAVGGVRPVKIHFVRVADGKLEHRLERDVQVEDGRRILLRVQPAAD